MDKELWDKLPEWEKARLKEYWRKSGYKGRKLKNENIGKSM